MSGASESSRTRRTSSATPGAEEDSTTCSVDVGRSRRAPLAASGADRRRSPARARACAATRVGRGAAQEDAELRLGGVRYWPSTASGNVPTICAACTARRGGRGRGTSGGSRGCGLLLRGLAVGRSARNQVLIFMAQPIVWPGWSVITSVAVDVLVGARRSRSPRRAPSSTSRFRRTTRVVARWTTPRGTGRSRRRRRGRRRRACRRAAGSRLAEDGDRALLAGELGEDAALRERLELAERDLLALVDRVGGRPARSAAPRSRPSRRRRRAGGPSRVFR